MSIVDSHVHLWDPARFRMPWLDGDATLCQRYERGEFDAASAGVAVDRIVYVQVDTTPAYGLLEARWAAQQPGVGAIVAFAPMEDGDVVRTYLDELVRTSPLIKGVRRLIQSEADPDFALQPGLIQGVRRLPEYGLSFDLCIKHHQLASTVKLVGACPETSFVLDHLGKPDIRGGVVDPWWGDLAELARLPNVVCKISGLVTEADHARWTTADLRPYVSHALEVFGEDRVLFGGDWPVVNVAASYQRWIEALTELTEGLSAQARDKLWRTNAQRVYRL